MSDGTPTQYSTTNFFMICCAVREQTFPVNHLANIREAVEKQTYMAATAAGCSYYHISRFHARLVTFVCQSARHLPRQSFFVPSSLSAGLIAQHKGSFAQMSKEKKGKSSSIPHQHTPPSPETLTSQVFKRGKLTWIVLVRLTWTPLGRGDSHASPYVFAMAGSLPDQRNNGRDEYYSPTQNEMKDGAAPPS